MHLHFSRDGSVPCTMYLWLSVQWVARRGKGPLNWPTTAHLCPAVNGTWTSEHVKSAKVIFIFIFIFANVISRKRGFPSDLCVVFLSEWKPRRCASNRSAGNHSPCIVSNFLQHYQGCIVFDVWDNLLQQDVDNAKRNSCEKHNRRSIWDYLDHFACILCVGTDTIARSKRPQGYIQISIEHDTAQTTRSTGRFLRRENLLRWEHEFR